MKELAPKAWYEPGPAPFPSVRDNRFRINLIEEDFEIENGDRIFEITIGNGLIAEQLAELHDEISIVSLDLMKMSYGDAEKHLVNCDSDRLIPLPASTYDRGFCFLAVAKLAKEEAIRLLTDVRRILAIGGRFRFAVPDSESPIFSGHPDQERGYIRAEAFEILEERLGFQIVSMKRFNPDPASLENDDGPFFLFDIRKPESN